MTLQSAHLQPALHRRCGSCERWQGPRSPGDDGDSVRIAAETDPGVCLGGPWDGAERRARMACGRWSRWSALVTDAV